VQNDRLFAVGDYERTIGMGKVLFDVPSLIVDRETAQVGEAFARDLIERDAGSIASRAGSCMSG
jgi:hypothetical protein